MYLDDIEIKLDSEIVFPYTPSLITNLEYSERGSFPEVKLWSFMQYIYNKIINKSILTQIK